MTEPTPQDYDSEDGWDDDHGIEQCPHCECIWSGNGGMLGPAFTQDGRKFELYLDASPGEGPFFCEDCWQELRINERQQANATLGEYGGGSG
jgi:hypothetical protein